MNTLIKKDNFKKVLCSILLVFVVIPYITTFAGDNLATTYVPNIKQSKTYWCWNASGVAVLGNRGKSVSQPSFSTTVKGDSTNNATATMSEVIRGLSAYGHSSTLTSTLTTSRIRSQLSSGKPIVAGYLHATGGHMVVISGHDSEGNYLEVMDPAEGKKVYYTPSYFTSNSKWTWKESIYNIN